MNTGKSMIAGMVSLLITILASSNAACSGGTCSAPESREINNGIHHSVQYLLDSLRPDGRFVYRRYFDPSVRPAHSKYNLLRHAGAIYALGLYNDLSGDQTVREPMQRAARFLLNCCVAPVPGHRDMLAVWSDQNTTGFPHYPLMAKLGGAGLGLVALMSVRKTGPGNDDTDMEVARRLGRFIVFMQQPDGRFFSRYLPVLTPARDGHGLLFYPGEAALGLLMLYQQDPDLLWLSTAVRALTFLADSRADASPEDVPKDNWALIASAMLLSLWSQQVTEEQTDKIYRHTALIARALLSDPPLEQTPVTAGALEARGRTVPTAMRLEGVLAALKLLPDDYAPLKSRLEKAADCGIGFLLRSQIIGGVLNGGMPVFPRFEDNLLRGPFAPSIRIDYVQHSLDAMIAYAEHRIAAKPSSCP